MKAFIHKIFDGLRTLFLRLHVIVTLQFGRDKVESDGCNPRVEDSKTRKLKGGKDNEE